MLADFLNLAKVKIACKIINRIPIELWHNILEFLIICYEYCYII